MSSIDWSNLKVVDLRAELSNRGLPTKGVKAELIARLNDDDAAQAETPEVQNEATSNDNAVASSEAGPEALENDTGVDTTASNVSVIANADTAAVEETQIDAEATTTSEQNATKPAAINEVEAIGEQTVQDTPVSEETPDFSTRKRRASRSRTPPPSAKRARQEHERAAEDREDIVDFDTGDITESVHDRGINGVGNEHAEEKNTDQNQVAEEKTQDTQGVSGEDAYLKRVAIAGSFEGPQLTSPTHKAPSEVSGEEAYKKRVAIAETLKASSPLTNEGQSLKDKDEDVKMEDATAAGPSKGTQSHEIPGGGSDDLDIPSTHQPTSALYIRELMRPLRPEVMEQYILDLLTPEGGEPDPTLVEDFFIDQIRTHAFVQLTSISTAKRVRAALHNKIWPNESNRKPLWVDFIPPSQVKEWIAEESVGSGAQSKRWEVAYEQKGDETVAVHMTSGSNSKPFSKPPPTGPAAGPTYPGIEAAPRGPRGRGGSRPENPHSLFTQAHPRLSYTPLSDDVARRRVDNMRSFYSKNPPPDLGKNYHRYTFENVDSFVDRGVEVFVGIRPPHREKEHQERLRREQSGTAGTSSANESRRDDARPRADGDRFSRHGDNRRSDRRGRHRGFRGGGPRRFQGEDPYRYRPGY